MRSLSVCLMVLCLSLPLLAQAETGLPGNYLKINKINLYYEVQGQGEPLLLLHGGLGNIASMAPQTEALARHYKVITPDSRAHGRSSGADGPLNYHLMASDMLGLMDELKIESAHFAGWSDGGIIALILAAEHPQRVRSVIALGSNIAADGMTDASIAFLKDWTAEAAGPAMAEAYREYAADPDLWPVFFDTVRHMWLEAPILEPNQLADIKVPTLLIVGDHDSIRPDHTRMIFDGIVGAQLFVVPGTSHFAPDEKPELINQVMIGFLAGVVEP